MNKETQPAGALRRGQVVRLERYGLVRFDGLDSFWGQVTAKLTGIDYPGTYYPFVKDIEAQGFTIVDAEPTPRQMAHE